MRNESFERIVGKEGSLSPSYIFMAILGYGVVLLGYALTAWRQGQHIIGFVAEMQPYHVWLAIIFGLFVLMCALPKYFQYRYVLPVIWCATLICVAEAFRMRQPAILEELRQFAELGLLIIVGIPIGLLYRLYGAYRKAELGPGASADIRNYILAMVMWIMCLAYVYISWRAYSDGMHHFLAGRPFIYVILVALGGVVCRL